MSPGGLLTYVNNDILLTHYNNDDDGQIVITYALLDLV